MAQSGPGDVTQVLQTWSCGNQNALDELAPSVCRELRRLAAAHLRREGCDQTPLTLGQILANPAKRHGAIKRGSGNKVGIEEAC